MRKRILSMLLALMMIASMLPMTALAANADAQLDDEVWFRDMKIHVANDGKGQKAPQTLNWTYNIAEGAGRIDLSDKASQAGYIGDSQTTSPKEFVNSTAYPGQANAYILNADVVANWKTEDAIKAGLLEQENVHLEDLNTPKITEGQYLVVDVKGPSGIHSYYSACLHVLPKQSAVAGVLSSQFMIKGEKAYQDDSGKWLYTKIEGEDAAENVTLSELARPNKDLSHIELKYGEAIGNGETVIKINRNSPPLSDASTLEVVMTMDLHDGSQNNVKKAFDDAKAAKQFVSGTSPLDIVGPEGGRVWVIAKVTSEDGSNCTYFVWWVQVLPQRSAPTITKIVVNADQSADSGYKLSKDVEFVGDLKGGDTPDNPSILTATLPGNIMYKGAVTKVLINKLNMTLTANGEIAVYAEEHHSASTGEVSFYNETIGKTAGKDKTYTLSFKKDFTKEQAVFLRTVVTYKDDNDKNVTVTKYYKLVLAQEAVSDDVSIHSGSVIGNRRTASVTGAITGELDKQGTGTNFAELTAEVPYVEPRKWDAYNASIVELTVDLGARANYIVTKSIYSKLDAKDFIDNPTIVSASAYYEDDFKNGVTKLTIPNPYNNKDSFDAQKERIYIQLIAPDGVTTSIFVLDDITMAAKGSEAKLTSVIPMQDNKELAEGTYSVQYGTQTGESDDPISVTVTIPYGSSDENLAAKLGASYDATIWNDANVDPVKTETLKLKIGGEGAKFHVVSGDKETTTFYILHITIAEVKDKDSSDSIVLNSQNGTLIVDPGTTVADVKNGLVYGGSLQVIGADDETVADTDKVATGYVAKVGSTELDIVVRGDVNKDGACGLADALLALKSTRGSVTLDALQAAAADVDGNAEVTLADALKILKSVRA